MIIRNSSIPSYFSCKDTDMYAVTIFPFIFLSDLSKCESDPIYTEDEIINHEKIHLQQILETGILGFYLIYLFEFMIKSISFKNIRVGYLSVGFEMEAYNHMKDLNYLNKRRRYSWLRFLCCMYDG